MKSRSRSRLRVNYLLEDTALFGGVKIALHHAELLSQRGHQVTVVSRGRRPDWYDLQARFVQAAEFCDRQMPPADVNVATFWTTIEPAAALSSGQAVHFCQGFEASYTHNLAEHPRIEAAYQTPIPGFGLAPHLAELLRTRFDRPARVVPPGLKPMWRPRPRWGPQRVPRVLVVHPFENQWKGVPTALEAVNLLRQQNISVRLVRLSQWPLGEEEQRLLQPDEYHHHLAPAQVARLTAGCDLLLAPSWTQEGFGLPVLEAMACGLPVVASDIPAFSYAVKAARLVPPHDPGALAAAAAAVLGDRRSWRTMRRAGLAVARGFAEQITGAAVAEAMDWVASGAWNPA